MSSNAIDWRALLVAAIAANPRGKAGVAVRLGWSREYVSRAMATGEGRSGFAKGVPPTFIATVINRLHVVNCPARADLPMPYADCAQALRPCPTSNVFDVRIWRICQHCPNKPEIDP